MKRQRLEGLTFTRACVPRSATDFPSTRSKDGSTSLLSKLVLLRHVTTDPATLGIPPAPACGPCRTQANTNPQEPPQATTATAASPSKASVPAVITATTARQYPTVPPSPTPSTRVASPAQEQGKDHTTSAAAVELELGPPPPPVPGLRRSAGAGRLPGLRPLGPLGQGSTLGLRSVPGGLGAQRPGSGSGPCLPVQPLVPLLRCMAVGSHAQAALGAVGSKAAACAPLPASKPAPPAAGVVPCPMARGPAKVPAVSALGGMHDGSRLGTGGVTYPARCPAEADAARRLGPHPSEFCCSEDDSDSEMDYSDGEDGDVESGADGSGSDDDDGCSARDSENDSVGSRIWSRGEGGDSANSSDAGSSHCNSGSASEEEERSSADIPNGEGSEDGDRVGSGSGGHTSTTISLAGPDPHPGEALDAALAEALAAVATGAVAQDPARAPPPLHAASGSGRGGRRYGPPWALLPRTCRVLRLCSSAARAIWPDLFVPARTAFQTVTLVIDIRPDEASDIGGGEAGATGAAAAAAAAAPPPPLVVHAQLRRYDDRVAVLRGFDVWPLLPAGIPWGTSLQVQPHPAGDGSALVRLPGPDLQRRMSAKRREARGWREPCADRRPISTLVPMMPVPQQPAVAAATASGGDGGAGGEGGAVVMRTRLGTRLYGSSPLKVSAAAANVLFGHLLGAAAPPPTAAAPAAAAPSTLPQPQTGAGGGGRSGGAGGLQPCGGKPGEGRLVVTRHITLLPADWPGTSFTVSLRYRYPDPTTARPGKAGAPMRVAPSVQLGPEVWSAVVLYGAEQADVLEVWRRPGGGPEEFCCRVVGPGADARAAARLAAAATAKG